MKERLLTPFLLCSILMPVISLGSELSESISADYDAYLAPLFEHFHRNPELSLVEFETAARMAVELEQAGFDVTTGVGGTGVVALLENGPGPMIAMRADMDGLPVLEQSSLRYASTAIQADPITGDEVPVMHACGHDTHITSLVGSARQMASRRDQWSGTLMLIVQPAEERGMGARAMRDDRIWERFGQPDIVLGFHVAAGIESGIVNILDGSPFAGVDSVDIIVHGVGAHGASPHAGKDPIVLASQIVLALQTLVSRELSPREPGVVTVGSFHSGTKHNIISDEAVLQLTVRNTNPQTRQKLLSGIERIATNLGRAAGLSEEDLPDVIIRDEWVPPLVNDADLAGRLRGVWQAAMGDERVAANPPEGMGGEDFPFFGMEPEIPIVFWRIGGTPASDIERASAGGPPVPSHHSPLFWVEPEPAIQAGVESTVLALLELMPVN
jgi:hippurate hydrolase